VHLGDIEVITYSELDEDAFMGMEQVQTVLHACESLVHVLLEHQQTSPPLHNAYTRLHRVTDPTGRYLLLQSLVGLHSQLILYNTVARLHSCLDTQYRILYRNWHNLMKWAAQTCGIGVPFTELHQYYKQRIQDKKPQRC